jgi:serine/threonine-protein kinase
VNVRRTLRDLGFVAAVFVLGYILSALWISPAPLVSGNSHAVPPLLGHPEREARTQLTALGFRPRVNGTQAHPTLPPGTVIWQDPPPGVVLAPNGIVTLTLSSGPASVPVPDITGLDTATARRILRAAGVRTGDIMTIGSGQREGGIVIVTRPGVGAIRPRGSQVDLIVSRGAEPVPEPAP